MIEPGNLIAIFSLVVMAYCYRPVFTTHFPDLTLAFDSSWPPVLTLRGFQGVQPHDRNAPPVAHAAARGIRLSNSGFSFATHVALQDQD